MHSTFFIYHNLQPKELNEVKTLILVRHAKSSWDNAGLSDFDRPLNERGKRDAPEMAKRLKDQKIKIDIFVSSPAKRAKETAKIFMEEYDEKKKHLLLLPELYEASVNDFYHALQQLDDDFKAAAVFSHNPGITAFVNSFECRVIDNMPTCAVFAIKIKTKHWKDFMSSKKEFLFFDYPKNEK